MLFGGQAGGRRPLVTEAIRGEGAILLDSKGNSVTAGVHPMGDLAPRDVVAAAIDARLKATGDPCVYLDARGIDGFETRFPTVTAACRTAGIDPVRQPIPVIPGAHYSCGGVVTDVYGQTELPGLFAAGEVARTGMHGANRLGLQQLAGRFGGRWPRRKGRGRTCGGGRAFARDLASDMARADHPHRAEARRIATRDEPGRLGGAQRRRAAPVVRDALGCAGPPSWPAVAISRTWRWR